MYLVRKYYKQHMSNIGSTKTSFNYLLQGHLIKLHFTLLSHSLTIIHMLACFNVSKEKSIKKHHEEQLHLKKTNKSLKQKLRIKIKSPMLYREELCVIMHVNQTTKKQNKN